MKYFEHFFRFAYRHIIKLSWFILLLLLISHNTICWFLLRLAGETQLTQFSNWFYYYVTTVTTVGYGDYTPNTVLGKNIAAFLVMPGGVILFAAFLGKLSSFFISIWRRSVQGQSDYSKLRNHFIILGWHAEKTPRILGLIFGDQRRKNQPVVLCSDKLMDNPYPGEVYFIKGVHLHNPDVFHRSGLLHAARVMVFQDTDEQTLATCLAVCATETKAHIVAGFESEQVRKLLSAHCPQVESHGSLALDLLVRSAQDPGSSRLQHNLLSTLDGPTQFSIKIPDTFTSISFSNLLFYFKIFHEAVVLAVADTATGDDILLNPPGNYEVKANQLIYYVSQERIYVEEINWNQLLNFKFST